MTHLDRKQRPFTQYIINCLALWSKSLLVNPVMGCIDVTPNVLAVDTLFGTALAVDGGSNSRDISFLCEALGTGTSSEKSQAGEKYPGTPVSSRNHNMRRKETLTSRDNLNIYRYEDIDM